VGEIRIGGKTGTAQVTTLGNEDSHERLKDHAWFVSYAPVDQPMIVVAALVENAGSGGLEAAPVSHSIMSKFFLKQGMVTVEEIEEHKFAPFVPAPAGGSVSPSTSSPVTPSINAAELPSLPSAGFPESGPDSRSDSGAVRARMEFPEDEDF